MNFVAILVTFIFLQRSFLLSLIGIFITIVLIVALNYTFINKNPFYTHYLWGVIINGSLFTIPLILVSSWLGFVIFLDLLYFYAMYRSNARYLRVSISQNRIAGRAAISGLNIRNLKQTWYDQNHDMDKKRRYMKELLVKKYNGNSLLRNSLILNFSLIAIFVLHVLA